MVGMYLLMGSLLALLAGCASGITGGPSVTTTVRSAADCPPAATVATWHLTTAGHLTVATDPQLPPAEFPSASNEPNGYDIDLAREFAKRLCLQLTTVSVPTQDIMPSIAGLVSDQPAFDIAMSSLMINDTRQHQAVLIPYFQAGEAVVVASNSTLQVSSVRDLCGKAVAVEEGTLEESDIDAANAAVCHTNPIAKQTYRSAAEAAQHVVDGPAEAAYQYSPVAGFNIKQSGGKLKMAGFATPLKPQGIAVRKDNAALKTALEDALAAMRKDGTYLTILQSWGVQDGVYPPL